MRIAIIHQSVDTQPIASALQLAEMEPDVIDQKTDWFQHAGLILADDVTLDAEQIQRLQAYSARGKPILGLGWGAACLVQSGIVPGLLDFCPAIRFVSEASPARARVRIADPYQYNAYTRRFSPKQVFGEQETFGAHFDIPVGLYAEMQQQGMLVLEAAESCPTSRWLGISNKVGNALALLVKLAPNRLAECLLQSMRAYIVAGEVQAVAPMQYFHRER